jgi:hypothetical protein
MRLAGAGPADQDGVALVGYEVAGSKIAHQRLVDRRVVEDEVVDVPDKRQLGNGDLVVDRTRLLLGDLRREQIADDTTRLVLALHGGGDDLVKGRLHAVELQRGLRHSNAVHHTGER